jgi:hypothetical protein
MSEAEKQPEITKNEIINTLKHRYSGKRNYNLFIPGFLIGTYISMRAKVVLAEPSFASIFVL